MTGVRVKVERTGDVEAAWYRPATMKNHTTAKMPASTPANASLQGNGMEGGVVASDRMDSMTDPTNPAEGKISSSAELRMRSTSLSVITPPSNRVSTEFLQVYFEEYLGLWQAWLLRSPPVL
jgi:hypothetical protein